MKQRRTKILKKIKVIFKVSKLRTILVRASYFGKLSHIFFRERTQQNSFLLAKICIFFYFFIIFLYSVSCNSSAAPALSGPRIWKILICNFISNKFSLKTPF